MSARTELLLYLAARAAIVEERIRPALDAGAVVVADRFGMSSVAYQGHGRGLPTEEVVRLNDFATGGLRPDVTILLDIPPGEGEARRLAAGRAADRIEREGEAFHRRVGEAYRLLARKEGGTVRVDGTGDPDAVHREVVRALHRRFPETFPSGEG
jgi:dTMP kinase